MDSSPKVQKLHSIISGTDFVNSVDQLVEFETDEALNLDEDEKDDDSDSENNSKYEDFIESSYEKLWEQMSPVDDGNLIRKMVVTEGSGNECIQDISVIKVHYAGYCENSSKPIAYTEENDPEIINLKDSKHLIGLLMALKSMKVGETSRFLISHKLMYGQYGCPPLIPPKAMCLFILSIVAELSVKTNNGENEENETTFQKVYKVARDLYVKGVFFFKKVEYNHAISSFRHSVRLLEFCRLADEIEEQKQQKFLAKLYVNLAICYNKLNMPLKACCMCNNLEYMEKLWNNSKALLHNARALSRLGEYKRAERRIKCAQSLDPNCQEIQDEINKICEMKAIADKNKAILENSTEFSFKTKQSNSLDQTTTKSPSNDFISSAEQYCKFVCDNEELFKIDLPLGLTKGESQTFIDMAKKYNLFYQCENDIVISISKMEISTQNDPVTEDFK